MKEINELIEYCKRFNHVFIYGAGLYGRLVRAFLSENGIEIKGFIVTNLFSAGETVLGVPVYNCSKLKDISCDNAGVIICAGGRYRKEITENLYKENFDNFLSASDELISWIQEKGTFRRKYNSTQFVTVFCYHRVTDNDLDTWHINVIKKLFEEEIKYISQNYNILRSDEEWSNTRGERAAVITFDDGYEDAYINVLPILEKYSVPATFFITTGNIGTEREFWWDELERVIFFADSEITEANVFDRRIKISTPEEKEAACYLIHPILKKMDFKERRLFLAELSKRLKAVEKRKSCRSMNIAQIQKLAASPLVTIGGHTVTHSCLAYENEEQQKWEIMISKKEIEEILGKEINVFSYPFGQRDDFTNETVRLLKESGYKKIFTAYAGIAGEDDAYGYIPRVNIGREKDIDSAVRKLKVYEYIYGDKAI